MASAFVFLCCCAEMAKFPRETFSEEVQQVPKNAPPPSGPLSIVLNSEDSMMVNLRDAHIGAVGRQLSNKAKEISAAFKVRERVPMILDESLSVHLAH